MKNLKGKPTKTLALVLVLVLLFSMTAFASQNGEEIDIVDDVVSAGEIDTSGATEETGEEENGDLKSKKSNRTSDAVLTDAIVAELEDAGIGVNPYALTANISNYDELLTVLSFPVFEGVVILNDFQFEGVITLDRDFSFSAATEIKSATLFSSKLGQRHFVLDKTKSFAVEFENIILDGNNSGGGILGNGGSRLQEKYISGVIIQNCSNTYGGAIEGHCYFTLANSVLRNNNAEHGGAIYASLHSYSIIDTTIENNHASRSGGGIYSGYHVSFSLINTRIENNSATNYGGGINFQGNITMTDGSISYNKAPNGSGVYAPISEINIFNMTNGEIIDNDILI